MRVYCRVFFDEVLDNGIFEVTFLVTTRNAKWRFLTCVGIVGFSIIVGGMMFFVGGKRFGRMEGVVDFVGEVICGSMEDVGNFVEGGFGIGREFTLVCEGLVV